MLAFCPSAANPNVQPTIHPICRSCGKSSRQRLRILSAHCLLANEFPPFEGEMAMKKTGIAVIALVATALALPSANARGYRHHGHCGYALHYDYQHGNVLSPSSYLYPAANWGPFFACRMYYGPIYVPIP
jgi:hypothetical protein